MKSCFKSAFKAFVSQFKENKFERAVKICIKNGYEVKPVSTKIEKK